MVPFSVLLLNIFGLLVFCMEKDIFSDEAIMAINNKQNKWKAGKNFDEKRAKELLQLIPRVKDPDKGKAFPFKKPKRKFNIPASFDSRKYWSKCKTMKSIPNQGNCDNSWAIAITATLSRRLCVQSSGKYDFHISADDLTRCCIIWKMDCSTSYYHGCYGGNTRYGYRYWLERGIVSGGYYQSKEGCRPYSEELFKYFEIYGESKDKPPERLLECIDTCSNPEYKKGYHKDRMKGHDVNYLYKEHPVYIQTEIMNNGPVQAEMQIYSDFLTYQSGIYFHNSTDDNETATWQGVIIVGWGQEDGINYWLVLNTWGSDWGQLGGYFKIIRGSNECQIESRVFAPIYRFGKRSANTTTKQKAKGNVPSSTTRVRIKNLILLIFVMLGTTCKLQFR